MHLYPTLVNALSNADLLNEDDIVAAHAHLRDPENRSTCLLSSLRRVSFSPEGGAGDLIRGLRGPVAGELSFSPGLCVCNASASNFPATASHKIYLCFSSA